MRLLIRIIQGIVWMSLLMVNVNASSLGNNTLIKDYNKLEKIKQYIKKNNIEKPQWDDRSEVNKWRKKNAIIWHTDKDSIHRKLTILATNDDGTNLTTKLEALINAVRCEETMKEQQGKKLNFYQKKEINNLKELVEKGNIGADKIKEEYKTYNKYHPFNEINFSFLNDILDKYNTQKEWEKFMKNCRLISLNKDLDKAMYDFKQSNKDEYQELDIITSLAIIVPLCSVAALVIVLLEERQKKTEKLKQEIEREEKEIERVDKKIEKLKETKKGKKEIEKLKQEKKRRKKKIEKLKQETERGRIDSDTVFPKALGLMAVLIFVVFLFFWIRNRKNQP